MIFVVFHQKNYLWLVTYLFKENMKIVLYSFAC